jgi:hypothetical protein
MVDWRMPIRSVILLPLFLLGAGASPAELRPAPGESAGLFAARVLGQNEPDFHVLDLSWNGRHTLFADYPVHIGSGERAHSGIALVALEEQAGGAYRRIAVTTAEEDGGDPEIAAIGFANADRDPAKELIVILAWPQIHYDYGGSFYEVQILDTPRRGAPRLARLDALSKHFGDGCDCDFRDGHRKPEHYRYKTIAAVKAELHRLGY